MEIQTGRLLSIHVGKVRRHSMPLSVRVDYRHPNWTSGIFKIPAAGPVHVSNSGIEGDEQADLDNHGGPDNVVLAYDASHYPVWQKNLSLTPDQIGPGSFGENFVVTGFSDQDVCIGDIWEVGPQALAGGAKPLTLQVTQSRQPCYKLARRLQQPHIVKLVRESAWGGWYLRVLHPGIAEAGMEIRLIERRHPAWTIAAAVGVMYARKREPALAAQLASLPELSTRWKSELLGN